MDEGLVLFLSALVFISLRGPSTAPVYRPGFLSYLEKRGSAAINLCPTARSAVLLPPRDFFTFPDIEAFLLAGGISPGS